MLFNGEHTPDVVTKKVMHLLNDWLDSLFVPWCTGRPFNNTTILLEDDTLGDLLVKLPLLEQIKGEKILLACGNNNGALLKYFIPEINQIEISFDKFLTNPVYRYKLLKQISENGWPSKMVVLLPYHRFSAIKSAAKIPSRRIVYAGEKIHEIRGNRSFDALMGKFDIIANPFKGNRLIDAHIGDHVGEIFRRAFGRKFRSSKEDYIEFFNRFKSNGQGTGDYVALIIGAGEGYRSYGRDKWQALLERLPKGQKIVMLGQGNMELSHPGLVNLVNKTSLPEAVDLILQAKWVIGNETGLTHLAYMSGIPTVCVLGGGHHGRFLPWAMFEDLVECVTAPMDCAPCGWNCSRADLKRVKAPCIDQISPDAIIRAIDRLDRRFHLQVFGQTNDGATGQ